MGEKTDRLINYLKTCTSFKDLEYVKTDDLGDHFVEWIERTEKSGGPLGLFFYVDEISNKVVVENIGKGP